jgi:hypothetical protein
MAREGVRVEELVVVTTIPASQRDAAVKAARPAVRAG